MSMIPDRSSRPSVHTGALHLFGLKGAVNRFQPPPI